MLGLSKLTDDLQPNMNILVTSIYKFPSYDHKTIFKTHDHFIFVMEILLFRKTVFILKWDPYVSPSIFKTIYLLYFI